MVPGIVLQTPSFADFDPPGPPAITDVLELRELSLTTGQDDGTIFGDDLAEICVTVMFSHPGHAIGGSSAGEAVKNVRCRSVNVTSPDDLGGPLETPFELVGEGTPLGKVFSPSHDECTASASWNFSIELKETGGGIADVLNLLGQALDLATKVPGLVPGAPNLNASEALKNIGGKIDEILNSETILGTNMEIWGGGEADSDGEVPRKGTLVDGNQVTNAEYEIVKIVQAIEGGEGQCPTPTTPTEVPCFDMRHLFSKSVQLAADSWTILLQAATQTGAITVDLGENRSIEQVEAQRLRARELVGLTAQLVAEHELEEAREAVEFIPAGTLNEAEGAFADANAMRDQAVVADSTELLREAVKRYRDVFELLAPLLHASCSEAVPVNELVTFVPLRPTIRTTSGATGCPAGFVGKFSFTARLTNADNSPALANLSFKVIELTHGNVVNNGEIGLGRGAILTVPQNDGFAEGGLSPGEFVDMPFVICLKSMRPFRFSGTVLGIFE